MAYSITKSLFKNSALMMMAQAATWVSGIVLLVFVARYLGSADYGYLYLALSIQTICQWIIDYGGQNYIPKEVSRNKTDPSDLMTQSMLLRIGLWVISMVLTFALSLIAGYSGRVIILIMILAFSNLWVNLTLLLRSGYQGFENMKYPSLATVVDRGLLTLTVIPALLLGMRVTAVAILMALTPVLNFLICWKYSKAMFRPKFTLQMDKFKRLLKDGLPYFLWSLFGVVYYRINAIMLSLMTPASVVGWYGAAFRFFGILMFLPAIYSAALYPILTRLSRSQAPSMISASQKSISFLLLAGIPIAVGLIFFSRFIVQILFGLKEFGPSAAIIQLFSAGMLLTYVDFVFGGIVLALDKQKQWAMIAFGAMVVNIGMNYLLIPYFQSHSGNGGMGAAIATDLTELFVMVSALFLMPRELFSRNLLATCGKGIAAGAIMSLSIVGAQSIGFPYYTLPVVGFLAYVVTLLATDAFNVSQLRYLLAEISIPGFVKTFSEKRRASA